MKIFVSYPHSESELAANLAARLRAEGHDVFWDRTSLPSGESFDDRIRDAIMRSELFICLMHKDSLDQGKYARTELKFAEQKWPNPSGNVLPVALDDEAMETIPPYLKAVTVKRPEGEQVAEIIAEVERIARAPRRRILRITRIAGIIALVVVVGWLAVKALEADPIELTMKMSGERYTEETRGSMQILRATTDYLQLLDSGLEGEEYADGEALYRLLEQDKKLNDAVSPLPSLQFGIVNNTDRMIIVDRLRLSVEESRLDKRPLLWSSSTQPGTNAILNASMMLGNNGWGATGAMRFNFDIVPEHDIRRAGETASWKFSQAIPAVDSGRTVIVAFWEELATFGTDITFLRDGPHPFGDWRAQRRFATDLAALEATIGVQDGERLFLIGELHFSWGERQKAVLLLKQQLQIVYPERIVSPAMFAEVEYEVELPYTGTDYQVERQIQHNIPPGATEAINLRIWCKKSSFHEMTASIRVGGDWIEARDAMRLEYYRPKNAEWRGGEE